MLFIGVMKHLFVKILLVLSLLALTSQCVLFKHTPKSDNVNGDIVMGTTMQNAFSFEATMAQVDSVCVADTLPTLNRWNGKQFEDFETGQIFTRLFFIKVIGKNNNVIYTLLIDDEEPYLFQKRVTK
jgi:hypothetical protein